MRKRRLLWLGVAACLILAGFALLFLLSKCLVTRENCEKIERGMTKQHVEALLGGPAGDYSSGLYYAEFVNNNGGFFEKEEWVGNQAAVRVWFDVKGEVFEKELAEVRPTSVGFWGWVHRRLRR